jgi:serine-type D-Ala-D-Ala carboxypeptidase (penicillin-binding protein 5/6)
MSQLISKTIFFIFLFSLLGGVIYYFTQSNKNKLLSPVLGISQIRMSDNLWNPKETTEQLDEKLAKKITAKSAFFVDINSGQVLFDKNSKERLRIASLTKIMTVIVAMDNKKLTDTLFVSEKAANTEPDKMLLKKDESLTLEELLDGIFLVSANDAAEVIAEESLGSGITLSDSIRAKNRDRFINLMNLKAKQLGMNDSYFINPSGLEEDDEMDPTKLKEQFSTAQDVSIMARYAIKRWPTLLNISSQPHIQIPETAMHQDYDLYTGINLLTTYPGVLGFKTGFTPEAGLTLVTFAIRDGREVLGVLLGSTSRRDDAKELLDYSFKKLGVQS